jgi:hypothetical protein
MHVSLQLQLPLAQTAIFNTMNINHGSIRLCRSMLAVLSAGTTHTAKLHITCKKYYHNSYYLIRIATTIGKSSCSPHDRHAQVKENQVIVSTISFHHVTGHLTIVSHSSSAVNSLERPAEHLLTDSVVVNHKDVRPPRCLPAKLAAGSSSSRRRRWQRHSTVDNVCFAVLALLHRDPLCWAAPGRPAHKSLCFAVWSALWRGVVIAHDCAVHLWLQCEGEPVHTVLAVRAVAAAAAVAVAVVHGV